MKEKMYIIKAQRAVFPEEAPILIYSKCGTIPPTQLPNQGALQRAVGDRNKAYFKCRVEGEKLLLLRELRHQHW